MHRHEFSSGAYGTEFYSRSKFRLVDGYTKLLSLCAAFWRELYREESRSLNLNRISLISQIVREMS